MSQKKSIGAWVVAGLLAIAFVGAGAMKLSGAPEMVANFARWGFPDGFVYVTGGIEVLGGLLLLLPRTSPVGVALMIPTMLGAILTHVVAAEFGAIVPPTVLLGLVALLGYLRRDQFRALMPGLKSPATT